MQVLIMYTKIHLTGEKSMNSVDAWNTETKIVSFQ